MDAILIEHLSPLVDPGLFGVSNFSQIVAREQRLANVIDRPKRNAKTVQKGHIYMNIGGGNQRQPSCPTLLDSSVASLSQMAFLAMTVSIFTAVASVVNNINNNNNNNNNNNLNVIKQSQSSISQNQNVVNQIDIDLPPPVPGKRRKKRDTRIWNNQRRLDRFFEALQQFISTQLD